MDELPTEALHEQTIDFLQYVKEEFRNPECPKCGHRLTEHVARFKGRSLDTDAVSFTRCRHVSMEEHKDYSDGKGTIRLNEKQCGCDLRHDEILFNLNKQNKEKTGRLDHIADENFRISKLEPDSSEIVIYEENRSGVTRFRLPDGTYRDL